MTVEASKLKGMQPLYLFSFKRPEITEKREQLFEFYMRVWFEERGNWSVYS